jgi:hypothetical protein
VRCSRAVSWFCVDALPVMVWQYLCGTTLVCLARTSRVHLAGGSTQVIWGAAKLVVLPIQGVWHCTWQVH